jgi:catechol 2,3-dioxygenase-like lactoylglutathione lyase family enzyme
MKLNGIDAVVLGVEDIGAGKRFYADFGLDSTAAGASFADFEARDGSQILVRRADDAGLPLAQAAGSTIREMIWGVGSATDLDEIATELARDRPVSRDPDGAVHSVDEDGYGIAFRIEQRRKPIPAANRLNIYGAEPNRPMNSRIDFLEAIRPASIAHVVVFSSDVLKATAFYVDRLGFRVSDRFRNGKGVFLRASGSTYHHNLFLIAGPKGLHHVAFPVTDFNDIMLGGQAMLQSGWETKIGPGRHRIGSNFFWYFKSPLGGAMELTADMDRADDDWPVQDWDFIPTNTAAWSVTFNPPQGG